MSIHPDSVEPISLNRPVALLRKMNHDIRNPLNAVLATANMLSEGMYDPLTPGQDRAVKRIERSALRMLTLLDDLIGYAKVEGGEYQLNPVDLDPRKLIESIRVECEPVAAEKDLALLISIADSVPATVYGDEILIRRVILALVWNAISFTAHGTVQITSAWSGDWQIAVTDTGPGIPATAAGRIFDVFWRGETAGSQVPTSGSGMGLAAAQAFAKLMKGELSLKESSDEGSVFVLRLPPPNSASK